MFTKIRFPCRAICARIRFGDPECDHGGTSSCRVKLGDVRVSSLPSPVFNCAPGVRIKTNISWLLSSKYNWKHGGGAACVAIHQPPARS